MDGAPGVCGWVGLFGEPVAEEGEVSQRQTIASGMVMRVKMKMPKLESRMSAA